MNEKRSKQPKPVTIDFETFGIDRRPHYPPLPVGVSIKWPGKKSKYWSWGHRSGNNCTRAQAKRELEKAWTHPDGILCHNAKFDLDVAEFHFGLRLPEPERVHETMFLLFLENPHSRDFGLKPSAEHYLGLPPDESDAVVEWLVKNQPVPGIKIGRGKDSKHPAGRYIALAPGKLVGDYAIGDTDRTEGLFSYLWPSIRDRGMLPAYLRERQLLPILLASERNGIRVAHERLRSDVRIYEGWVEKLDVWIRNKLDNPVTASKKDQNKLEPINLDSSPQLAAALIEKGFADPSLMGVTPSGAVAMNKDAVKAGVIDKQLAAILQYRTQLKTCLGTFMTVWLEMADVSGGYIYTTWNQVKAVLGARTGRLSSSPNFQNMPKEFAALFAHEADREEDPKRRKALKLVKSPWGSKLPLLPLCRSYIIAYADGEVLVGRDYSQQEPRILGHFEDGELMAQYRANPWIDYHDNAKDHLERVMGRPYQRKPVKNINLGIIYGQGVSSLAEKNNSTVAETKEIRDTIYALYPGLKAMYRDMERRAKAKEPIVTWGGREVYCEKPIVFGGRMITFDYKMVNYLVQGSAADCTKEALIRLDAAIKRKHNRGWRMLLQVHDEIVLSVPFADLEEAQETMRECMESVEFDVLILSEGAWSNDNWAAMKDWDKKGKRVNG